VGSDCQENQKAKVKGQKLKMKKVRDWNPFHLLCSSYFCLLPFAICLLTFLLPPLYASDFTFGPLSFSGNLQTQQIFRHPEPDKWSIIQQRNVVRLRLEHDWIKEGPAFDYLSVPWIRRAHLVAL
jgi:hypothetical protein